MNKKLKKNLAQTTELQDELAEWKGHINMAQY
jgi:hypothetical protein